MTLLATISGALPDVPFVSTVPQAPKRPGGRRPVEWSHNRIAAFIGIGPSTLTRLFKEHEELRRILGRGGSSTRRCSIPTTREQVVEAAAYVLALPFFAWGAREHSVCVVCGTTESRHWGRGICVRCRRRQTKRHPGHVHRAKPGAWCEVLGTDRCSVCWRDDVDHHSHGRCCACGNWARRTSLDERAPSDRERMSAARRARLRRRGIKVGRKP